MTAILSRHISLPLPLFVYVSSSIYVYFYAENIVNEMYGWVIVKRVHDKTSPFAL